mgnify:CR=1 FL=1
MVGTHSQSRYDMLSPAFCRCLNCCNSSCLGLSLVTYMDSFDVTSKVIQVYILLILQSLLVLFHFFYSFSCVHFLSFLFFILYSPIIIKIKNYFYLKSSIIWIIIIINRHTRYPFLFKVHRLFSLL